MHISATCLKPKSAHGEAMQQGCVTVVSSCTLRGRSHWDLLSTRCYLFKNRRKKCMKLSMCYLLPSLKS